MKERRDRPLPLLDAVGRLGTPAKCVSVTEMGAVGVSVKGRLACVVRGVGMASRLVQDQVGRLQSFVWRQLWMQSADTVDVPCGCSLESCEERFDSRGALERVLEVVEARCLAG